jgi:selenocysteine lyase/cysteine desulfurase
MNLIPSQRRHFAMPADIHYLNCAYMSPLSNEAVTAMETGARLKAAPWTYKPQDFFSVCEEFRERAGRIMNVSPDSIAIVPSASYGLATAARNLPVSRGQEIIVLADQFPSNLYIWREKAAEVGGHIVTVYRDAQAAWTDAVLDAIDADTAIVAVPHCHWADGRVVDLEVVGAKCRAHGAALVLDLTQSLGAMPIDFAKVQPDFAVAACYKWLMGPYGTAMLYVDAQHQGGNPIEQNWINRAGAEDFARLVDYRNDFQPGARRFDMGEKSNPPLLLGAIAGLDFLLQFGVQAVAETLATYGDAIADLAMPLGIEAAPVGIRAAHFLSLGFPDGVPEGLTDRLAAANVFASLRSTSLRVTPHLYNEPRDWQRLIAVLEESL